MTTKIERCAIYIRVSTTEQMMHGKSLEAQKEYFALTILPKRGTGSSFW